jgi:hypothetical protein
MNSVTTGQLSEDSPVRTQEGAARARVSRGLRGLLTNVSVVSRRALDPC